MDNEVEAINSPTWKITKEHILKALGNLNPSILPKERKFYQTIYSDFLNSGGDFIQTTFTPGKKQTLA